MIYQLEDNEYDDDVVFEPSVTVYLTLHVIQDVIMTLIQSMCLLMPVKYLGFIQSILHVDDQPTHRMT